MTIQQTHITLSQEKVEQMENMRVSEKCAASAVYKKLYWENLWAEGPGGYMCVNSARAEHKTDMALFLLPAGR